MAEDGVKEVAKPVLGRLHQTCSVPTLGDLKENFECIICQNTFLSGTQPEFPIKLPCGHVFGQMCIARWLNPCSNESTNCPLCRTPVFSNAAVDDHTPLAPIPLEHPGPERDANSWLAVAEALYHELCKELISRLEDQQSSREYIRLYSIVLEVIYTNNVLTFRGLFMSGESQPLRQKLRRVVPGSFMELMGHLEECGGAADAPIYRVGASAHSLGYCDRIRRSRERPWNQSRRT